MKEQTINYVKPIELAKRYERHGLNLIQQDLLREA